MAALVEPDAVPCVGCAANQPHQSLTSVFPARGENAIGRFSGEFFFDGSEVIVAHKHAAVIAIEGEGSAMAAQQLAALQKQLAALTAALAPGEATPDAQSAKASTEGQHRRPAPRQNT